MNIKPVLNNSEKALRQSWLISLVAYYLGNLMVRISTEPLSTLNVISTTFDEVLFFLLMYYFAFIRFGTFWIGCFLFFAPIAFLIDTFKTFGSETSNLGLWSAQLFSFALLVPFWILSNKLYEMNKTIHKKVPESNSDSFDDCIEVEATRLS